MQEILPIARVAGRVQLGGHFVPEETIRRRHAAGLRNFFNLYSPIADSWSFYDNTDINGYRLMSQTARVDASMQILDNELWDPHSSESRWGNGHER